MASKFKNKYRIESTRLPNWDYGWNAAYFVTICTKHRRFFFGNVVNGIMGLSEIGCLAWQFWYEIPDHFPFVILDAFIVMPDHVHGIIVINKTDMVETRQCLVSTNATIHHPSHKIDRFQNPGKKTLSSIVGSYKSVLSTHAHKIKPEFDWQSRFDDRIIRDERAFKNVAKYIRDNPLHWKRKI